MNDSIFLSVIFFSINVLKESVPIDKMFLDAIDYIFFMKHYQPMPVRWLIIDTFGSVTIISYSAVCTEDSLFKTFESIAGCPEEIILFKKDLQIFCMENGFDMKSKLFIRIFKGLSLLSRIEKPKFDYKKRLVFPERQIQALNFINVIRQIAHSITLLVYSDREVIRKDEDKFKFFKFILLRNIKKDYTTKILYENKFYKFYNGWFS